MEENNEMMELIEVAEDEVVMDDITCDEGSSTGKTLLIGAAIIGAGIAAWKLGKKAWKKHKAKKEVVVMQTGDEEPVIEADYVEVEEKPAKK